MSPWRAELLTDEMQGGFATEMFPRVSVCVCLVSTRMTAHVQEFVRCAFRCRPSVGSSVGANRELCTEVIYSFLNIWSAEKSA